MAQCKEGAQHLSQMQQAAVSQSLEQKGNSSWHTSELIAAGWLEA